MIAYLVALLARVRFTINQVAGGESTLLVHFTLLLCEDLRHNKLKILLCTSTVVGTDNGAKSIRRTSNIIKIHILRRER